MRQVTQRGRDLIILFENLSLSAYKCPAGHLTIGVGHMLTRSEISSGKLTMGLDRIRWRDGITREDAMRLLTIDLYQPEQAVALGLPDLTDNQFDALVSLVFNIGIGAWEGSTIRRLLLKGDTAGAAEQFPRWKYAGGRVLPGLVTRRERERALFLAA